MYLLSSRLCFGLQEREFYDDLFFSTISIEKSIIRFLNKVLAFRFVFPVNDIIFVLGKFKSLTQETGSRSFYGMQPG